MSDTSNCNKEDFHLLKKIKITHSKLYLLIKRSVSGDGLAYQVAVTSSVEKERVADLVLS